MIWIHFFIIQKLVIFVYIQNKLHPLCIVEFILSTSPFIFRRSNSSWRMQVIMPQNCKILALLTFVSTYEKWYFSEKAISGHLKLGPDLDVMYDKGQHFGSGSNDQFNIQSCACWTTLYRYTQTREKWDHLYVWKIILILASKK